MYELEEKCINCHWFKKSYSDNGYCELWDMYTKDNNGCDDFEEEYRRD